MEKNWFEFDRENGKIGVLQAGKMPLIITKEDFNISYFSTGHGGQNANRHMNGVRLIYHIPANYQLSFRKTKEIMARSIGQRKREANFEEAFQSMAEKIEAYFYVPPRREKTRVPRSSKQKRVADKKLHSQIKAGRKHVDF